MCVSGGAQLVRGDGAVRHIHILKYTHTQVNIATLEHLQLSYPCITSPLLNELRGGDLDGWSRDDIRLK